MEDSFMTAAEAVVDYEPINTNYQVARYNTDETFDFEVTIEAIEGKVIIGGCKAGNELVLPYSVVELSLIEAVKLVNDLMIKIALALEQQKALAQEATPAT
jgi:hypothetical protein